jgi:hypothetical protein
MSTDDLLKLARFQMLDSRNCNEEAKDGLLGQMADEIERLQGIIHSGASATPGSDTVHCGGCDGYRCNGLSVSRDEDGRAFLSENLGGNS